ncbi:MAG: CRISPR-associated endonuclease Cas2 [Deltaproteobacteria bacterium]|nr:CRISPR-associated endonuclease Cas2 [Deltaproteobacteria bacterium]
MKRNYLVGYDISDQKRLAKVAKVMTEFGLRIQYSFFHCILADRQKKRMKERLTDIIKEGDDQIIILPVTERQLKEIEFVGFKINLHMEGIIIV